MTEKNKGQHGIALYGWTCPRCGTVYSPFTHECTRCGPVCVTTTHVPTSNTGGDSMRPFDVMKLSPAVRDLVLAASVEAYLADKEGGE